MHHCSYYTDTVCVTKWGEVFVAKRVEYLQLNRGVVTAEWEEVTCSKRNK